MSVVVDSNVFWRNEERKVGYVSIYMKNKVAKSSEVIR